MNPLRWKQEDQLAGCIIIMLGAILGLLLGWLWSPFSHAQGTQIGGFFMTWLRYPDAYWPWIAFGAVIAEAGRGLSRSLESEHGLVPGDTRQTVSFLPSLGRALRRMPNRTAVNALARLGAHQARMLQ